MNLRLSLQDIPNLDVLPNLDGGTDGANLGYVSTTLL